MLEEMSKNQLQLAYEQKFKTAPEAKLTKAELIDALNAEAHTLTDKDIADNAPGLDDLKPGDVIGIPPAEVLGDNEFIIVKMDAEGKIIDRQTTNRDVWNLLPDHKFGFKKEPPKEAQ